MFFLLIQETKKILLSEKIKRNWILNLFIKVKKFCLLNVRNYVWNWGLVYLSAKEGFNDLFLISTKRKIIFKISLTLANDARFKKFYALRFLRKTMLNNALKKYLVSWNIQKSWYQIIWRKLKKSKFIYIFNKIYLIDRK
jgi:hypothetical protein